jgi:prepilin-type N-terminal cleavage/methylation domain-containing protein
VHVIAAARRTDGFTLPEVLTAMAVGIILSVAAFTLVSVTIKRAGEVTGRVEANQKGRAAMDTITQHLRSQVCLSSTTPPIVTGQANYVSFYADLSDGSAGRPPERHELTYDSAQRTLVETDYIGTRAGTAIAYPATPSRTRTLALDVWPDRPVGATQDTPVFRYYAYDESTPPRPVEALPTPLSDRDRARAVRLEITFRAQPPRSTQANARGSILLHDDVYVRAADPDDPRDVRAFDPDDPNPVPPICA